jgi:hypothetical protein
MAIDIKECTLDYSLDREYPYLGKSKNGQIVLFTSENTGTNVNGVISHMGTYSTEWFESTFKPLAPTESITLSNKPCNEQ